jgi:hypothetical protein
MGDGMPTKLTITNAAFMLDGGTTSLSATDETGNSHLVRLAQHAYDWPGAPPHRIPGHLYFDDEVVTVRSADEAVILQLLRNADVQLERTDEPPIGERIELSKNALILGDDIKRVLANTPEQNLREMLQQVIDYVGSAEYVQFAEAVERNRFGKQ